MTGTSRVRESSRSRRVNSNPSMPGMLRSVTTTCGRESNARSSAWRPLWASSTWNPACLNQSAYMRRPSRSSSTRSTIGVDSPACTWVSGDQVYGGRVREDQTPKASDPASDKASKAELVPRSSEDSLPALFRDSVDRIAACHRVRSAAGLLRRSSTVHVWVEEIPNCPRDLMVSCKQYSCLPPPAFQVGGPSRH